MTAAEATPVPGCVCPPSYVRDTCHGHTENACPFKGKFGLELRRAHEAARAAGQLDPVTDDRADRAIAAAAARLSAAALASPSCPRCGQTMVLAGRCATCDTADHDQGAQLGMFDLAPTPTRTTNKRPALAGQEGLF